MGAGVRVACGDPHPASSTAHAKRHDKERNALGLRKAAGKIRVILNMSAVSNQPKSLSIERPALYVIASPIGNLGDISYRAVETLAALDLLLVEDTRVSQRLLQHYAIGTRTRALHEHNEREVVDNLLADILARSLAVGLLSDAGTPLIADPGYRLVRAAHAQAIPVRALPGPSAVITALSVSGLATDRFFFEGFLPAKSGARERRLKALVNESQTLVFYEAPHRIHECISDMCSVFGGERDAVVARELTKLHETLYRGTLASLSEELAQDEHASRGEIVVMVAGAEVDDRPLAETRALEMIPTMTNYLSRADAIKLAAELTGAKRNVLYQRVGHTTDK